MQTWGVVEIKVFKKQQGDGRKLKKKKANEKQRFWISILPFANKQGC